MTNARDLALGANSKMSSPLPEFQIPGMALNHANRRNPTDFGTMPHLVHKARFALFRLLAR